MPLSIPEFPDLTNKSIQSVFLKRGKILTNEGFLPLKKRGKKIKKLETLASSTFPNELEERPKLKIQKRFFSV